MATETPGCACRPGSGARTDSRISPTASALATSPALRRRSDTTLTPFDEPGRNYLETTRHACLRLSDRDPIPGSAPHPRLAAPLGPRYLSLRGVYSALRRIT